MEMPADRRGLLPRTLQRMTWLVDLNPASPRMSATMFRWHAMPTVIGMPRQSRAILGPLEA
jgi:hypothetical protein